jgi:hypothetical protein
MAAGYDPVRGPGTSCLDSGASGKCVLPWRGGTMAVSSVTLLANGLSFAVRRILEVLDCSTSLSFSGNDHYSYGRWPSS